MTTGPGRFSGPAIHGTCLPVSRDAIPERPDDGPAGCRPPANMPGRVYADLNSSRSLLRLLLLASMDVNPNADGELISGIEHGTKGLVQPLDDIKQVFATDLVPGAAIELRVIMEHNPGGNRLLHTQHMST